MAFGFFSSFSVYNIEINAISICYQHHLIWNFFCVAHLIFFIFLIQLRHRFFRHCVQKRFLFEIEEKSSRFYTVTWLQQKNSTWKNRTVHVFRMYVLCTKLFHFCWRFFVSIFRWKIEPSIGTWITTINYDFLLIVRKRIWTSTFVSNRPLFTIAYNEANGFE